MVKYDLDFIMFGECTGVRACGACGEHERTRYANGGTARVRREEGSGGGRRPRQNVGKVMALCRTYLDG